MESRSVPVLVETAGQVDKAVDILVGAFYDDPTWAAGFPDVQARRDQHRWLWNLAVEGAARYPFVWLTPFATAVWIPPGGSELSSAQERELELGLKERLGANASRILQAFERFDENHPKNEPHYYLSLLGTDPAHRGHGYGLSLLADNLARIDDEGFAVYLEASNPANVSLYERFGFAVRGGFQPFDDGPVVATMWRDSRG